MCVVCWFVCSVEELYPGRPYGALDSGFNSVDSGDKRWSGNEVRHTHTQTHTHTHTHTQYLHREYLKPSEMTQRQLLLVFHIYSAVCTNHLNSTQIIYTSTFSLYVSGQIQIHMTSYFLAVH